MKHYYYHYNRLVDYLRDLHDNKAHYFDEADTENVFCFFQKRDIESRDDLFNQRTPLMWCVGLILYHLAEQLIAHNPKCIDDLDGDGNPVWYYCLKKSHYPPVFVAYIEPYKDVLDFSVPCRNRNNPFHVHLFAWKGTSYNERPFFEHTFVELLKWFQNTPSATHVELPNLFFSANTDGVRPIDLLLDIQSSNQTVSNCIAIAQSLAQKTRLEQTICADISQFKEKSLRKI